MSDEELVFESPEEAQAYFQAEHDRLSMMNDVARHEVVNMFQELPRDHARAFQAVLEYIQNSGENAPIIAAHYGGFLGAEMQRRFDICAACGRNHHEELLPTGGDS